LLLGLSGCGGFFVPQTSSGGTTNTGDYLYVANGNNTYLAGFSVASTGALSVLSGSPYNNSVAAQSLAVNPANTFLYAGTTAGIFVYGINSDGSITVQNDGSVAAQDIVATAMQVDSTGNYLLAVGISTAQQVQAIGIYTIDTSTGLLTAVTGSPLALYTGNTSTPTVVAPTGLLITPNNSYVYASLGTLGVQVLTLGSGGALAAGATPTLLAPLKTSTSPSDQRTASDPNSAFLFVAEINTGLRVFSIGSGGSLSEVSGSPYAVGTGPTAVDVDATGSYVYVANKGSNNISAFTLTAASGKLTAVAGSPFSSGGQLPIGIVNDNSKNFVAVINSGTNDSGGNSDLQLFKFDATVDGKLDPVATATTGTDPTNPSSIAATH
jgi:6-phosphogluconolactonase